MLRHHDGVPWSCNLGGPKFGLRSTFVQPELSGLTVLRRVALHPFESGSHRLRLRVSIKGIARLERTDLLSKLRLQSQPRLVVDREYFRSLLRLRRLFPLVTFGFRSCACIQAMAFAPIVPGAYGCHQADENESKKQQPSPIRHFSG